MGGGISSAQSAFGLRTPLSKALPLRLSRERRHACRPLKRLEPAGTSAPPVHIPAPPHLLPLPSAALPLLLRPPPALKPPQKPTMGPPLLPLVPLLPFVGRVSSSCGSLLQVGRGRPEGQRVGQGVSPSQDLFREGSPCPFLSLALPFESSVPPAAAPALQHWQAHSSTPRSPVHGVHDGFEVDDVLRQRLQLRPRGRQLRVCLPQVGWQSAHTTQGMKSNNPLSLAYCSDLQPFSCWSRACVQASCPPTHPPLPSRLQQVAQLSQRH